MRKIYCKSLALMASVAFVVLLAACPQGGGTVINNYYVESGETEEPMKFIPAGTYTILYNGIGTDTTKEAKVVLSSYYICDHEVTQAEWLEVFDVNPSFFQGDDDAKKVQLNRPVEQVSWYDAISYCNKRSIKEGLELVYSVKIDDGAGNKVEIDWANLAYADIPTTGNDDWNNVSCDFSKNGYRLPTEVEREVAARGGLTGDVWAGCASESRLGNYAWYKGNSDGKTHEVMKKLPNALGLYDMTGNVFEFSWDKFDNSTEYPSGVYDPTGPDATYNDHHCGGGGYDSNARYNRICHRANILPPSFRYESSGLRVVRSHLTK